MITLFLSKVLVVVILFISSMFFGYELSEQLEAQGIEIALLTVPQEEAAEAVERLVAAGIKGILNFTPLRFDVPSHVRMQHVDLTNELQTLIYFIDSNMHQHDDFVDFRRH